MYADAHTQVNMFADQCKFFSYFPCASCYVFRPWVSPRQSLSHVGSFSRTRSTVGTWSVVFNPPTTTTNNNLNTKYKMLVLMHKYYTLFFSWPHHRYPNLLLHQWLLSQRINRINTVPPSPLPSYYHDAHSQWRFPATSFSVSLCASVQWGYIFVPLQ